MKQKVFEMNKPENREIKHKYVQKMFDSISPNYDLMNTVTSFGMHYLWRKKAVRLAGVRQGNTALDICCGTGDFSIALAKATGPNGRVSGLDFSTEMIKKAKEKIRGTNFEKVISYREGNAEQLPFSDDTFDFCAVGYGVRNLADGERGFLEMRRVIKPGGRVICLDLGHPTIPVFRPIYMFYLFRVVPFLGRIMSPQSEAYTYLPHSLNTFLTQDELKKLMEKIGLKDVRYWNILGGVMAIHIGAK